jgi:2-polyprenyl-3-methyl-5-hydroxy-6-metoxy-1,4-benzoquinol methylase
MVSTAQESQMTASLATVWSQASYQFKCDQYSSHAVILNRAGEGKGKRLLDVGAAEGYLAELFRSSEFEVVCLEGNPFFVTALRNKNFQVVHADLDLPVPELPGPFDVIICGDVLEHLKDPLGVLKRLSLELKQNGKLIVSVPNIAHLWMRVQLALGRFDYADRGILDRTHLRFFTLRSFHELLREADLEVTELTTTPVPLPLLIPARWQGKAFNVLHRISAWWSRTWPRGLAYQFVAVTRRRTGQ